ncbi:hypothetical protein FACS1894169_08770 [Bacteroidia bacterium]|nr:hypothetical protein FACS1894169_08770 [Bacteroidia bacterium]
MVINAIFAIIAFILVYLILLILGIALTALCIYGGVALVIAAPKFITIAIGIGLASLGIIIFIFLVKFLFKEHEIDKSHLTEVHRKGYPELFNFIEEIAVEAKIKFPKKIYLSRDVNAAVFYNSSFWSMFFPIRKNLQIGLGLVNTVTEQELKAIIAHEFGHFSQRSMSVGSYVYNVNEVIFNMLYDNDSFDQSIQAWANISGYFSIFVIIAVKIIQGIQWILRKMYSLVNIRYMALSREMEFHADEVAANITGSKPLIDSLLRLELSQLAYNSTLNFYENKSENNIISKNIYKDQLFTLEILAKENNIPLKNRLPLVTVLDINKYNRSKIKIENRWASHPSTEERVNALLKLNIVKSENRENLAITLLPDKEKLEEELTKLIFYYSTFRKETVVMENDEFQKGFMENIVANQFPKEYNTYYDSKNPIPFDPDSIMIPDQTETLEDLFGKEKVNWAYNYITLESDKNMLNAISRKEIRVKTFEYEGYKYKAEQADDIITKIDRELENSKKQIAENDINIYRFFYNQALKKGCNNELKNKYRSFFSQNIILDERIIIYNGFVDIANRLSIATQPNQIKSIFIEIAHSGIELKSEIKNITENPLLEKEITEPIKNNFNEYLAKEWSYSANDTLNNEYLNTLFAAVNDFRLITSREYFLIKQDLLNYQISLL